MAFFFNSNICFGDSLEISTRRIQQVQNIHASHVSVFMRTQFKDYNFGAKIMVIFSKATHFMIHT